MKFLSIEGNSDLVKDPNTGAILNTSSNIAVARRAKEARKQKEKELIELKEEVKELKTMLNVLLNKLDN